MGSEGEGNKREYRLAKKAVNVRRSSPSTELIITRSVWAKQALINTQVVSPLPESWRVQIINWRPTLKGFQSFNSFTNEMHFPSAPYPFAELFHTPYSRANIRSHARLDAFLSSVLCGRSGSPWSWK